jgi:hypothetical protein
MAATEESTGKNWSGKNLGVRLGAAGFTFFLVKGLLWLAVPIALATWHSQIP